MVLVFITDFFGALPQICTQRESLSYFTLVLALLLFVATFVTHSKNHHQNEKRGAEFDKSC